MEKRNFSDYYIEKRENTEVKGNTIYIKCVIHIGGASRKDAERERMAAKTKAPAALCCRGDNAI